MIETLHLKGAGVDIPALIIGEEGRGRERGVVPIDNPPVVPCPDQGKTWGDTRAHFFLGCADACSTCGAKMECVGNALRHPNTGEIRGALVFAEVGKTKAGKPKFWAKAEATNEEFVIVVFRTKIGFRGGNDHTGDRSGWRCSNYGCGASSEGVVPDKCPKCGGISGAWDGPKTIFATFPGEIIAQGRIAEGAAGRAGGGDQLIALVPKGVVFRTAYSGRLYGKPSSHYYKWDGEHLLAATWEERASADLF